MKPLLALAAASALVGVAAPAGAAPCGCYHYHRVHHFYRPAPRVIYRTRVVVEPPRTVVEAAAPAPYDYPPRPFYGPRRFYGYGYAPRRFGPWGWRRPYGWDRY